VAQPVAQVKRLIRLLLSSSPFWLIEVRRNAFWGRGHPPSAPPGPRFTHVAPAISRQKTIDDVVIFLATLIIHVVNNSFPAFQA